MNGTDWDFLFGLLNLLPEEGRQLLEKLREKYYDRAQRAVVADWFYENGYDACALSIRKGYTPGGLRGSDLDRPEPSGVLSGSIASGSIGTYQLASGLVHYSHIASGSMTINRPATSAQAPPRTGSAYEDFHS